MSYHDDRNSMHYQQPSSTGHLESRPFQTNTFSSQAMPDLEPTRSRRLSGSQQDGYSSDSSRYQQARQPINEAVTSAFNTTEASTSASLPPEFITQLTSQITANVIQQLKATNIATPLSATHGTQPDNLSSTTSSPPMDRATVYTPPSPYRASEEAAQTQFSSIGEARGGQQAYGRGTPPVHTRSISPLGTSADDSDPREDRPTRPLGPKRISTSGDATILEKVWGTLFNEQGQATVRLGQFLRGIAVHLIEDYEPVHSLVVTPTKLQKYYQDTLVASELYPWHIVFDDRTSSISRMYREIEAQHHLVQEKVHERPDIPGLTPQGFETWATLLIKAHPDQEFERLAKTALDMPISNPDDKKERFPKELSRRLFPKDPDLNIAAKLQKAMTAHCNITFSSRHDSNAGENQPAVLSQQGSRTESSGLSEASFQAAERAEASKTFPGVRFNDSPPTTYATMDRKSQSSYSNTPSETAVEEDGDATPTPQPIERERKPYVAQPGGGKTYDTAEKAPLPTSEAKLARSLSLGGGHRSGEHGRSRPPPIAIHQKPGQTSSADFPEPRHHRTNSSHHKEHTSRSGRNRSPSISKETGGYGRKSESDASHGSHYPTSISDGIDDSRRYRDYESHRERLANDRYDAARMSAYDPRDRERDRDVRPRGMSTAGYEPLKHSMSAEEEYYRNPTGYSGFRENYQPYPLSAQYPPSAYREDRMR